MIFALVAIGVLATRLGGDRHGATASGAAELGTTNDINPQNPATLVDGGNLRLGLSEFPVNWNTLHIDGNSAETASMLKPTLPRAFIIKPDGSTTLNTDYFTNVELTKTDPQVVTYTINPQSGLVRRHADHVGGHQGSDPRPERQGQSLLDRQPRRCRTRRVRDSRGRRPAGRDDVRQAVCGMEGHVRGQRDAAASQHDVDSRGVQQRRNWAAPVRRPDPSSSQGRQGGPADHADA